MNEALTIGDELRAGYERLITSPSPPWLKSLRTAAFNRFEALGFPRPSNEAWKYTNVAPIAAQRFSTEPERPSISRSQLSHLQIPGLDAHQLVFVNGTYAPELSTLRELPRGVRVQSLSTLLEKSPDALEPHVAQYADFEHQAFTALNTALFRDGALIEIPRGLVLATPIHLLHIAAPSRGPAAYFPRLVLRAGPLSQASVIESFTGVGKHPYFVNAVTEVHADDGAVLHHAKLQRETEHAYHIHTIHIEQEGTTNVHDHQFTFGARLSRTDLTTRFNGEGADLTLNGLYVLNGEQHADHHTFVDHARPRCTSRQFYKGILDGKSRGVFYGKVVVRKDAQKTNANQTNKNLLLSDGALVDSTPALEINADDVKCSHGSTIGQLEKDAVFYLRSRGLDEPTARSLLTYAFARDLIGKIPWDGLRSHLEGLLLAQLPNGRAVKEVLHEHP